MNDQKNAQVERAQKLLDDEKKAAADKKDKET